jgi:NitT/TauT family transport system substrate-binding protein
VPSSAGVQQQLAAGALELSDAGLNDQVRAIFEGAPIALVRLEGQVPPYALLSQPAIKSIGELRGKTLMVGGEKDITRVYLERMLGQVGIKPGEYDLLYSGATIARFAALQSGAVSAAILYPPFNFRAESAGFTNLGLVVDYLKNIPFSGFSVNTTWAAQKKDRVQRFLAAYTKAVAWFDDDTNRSEAIRMMVEVTRQPQEDTEKSYELFRKINFFERKGEVSKKKVAEIIEILRSDMRDKPLDINRLFLTGVPNSIGSVAGGLAAFRHKSSCHHSGLRSLRSSPGMTERVFLWRITISERSEHNEPYSSRTRKMMSVERSPLEPPIMGQAEPTAITGCSARSVTVSPGTAEEV